MKYILGVSGGPDSMAMLHMYRKKTQAVCVVNYKKREDSDHDVSLVVDFCNLYNIKYYIHNVTQKTYENNKKLNFQTLARQIRYNFFLKICKKEQNMNLLIAHNLNDHLETAYMQFSRNSRSLFYGIVEKSNYLGLKIKRPLIRLQKSTLERYCKQKDVKYAIDHTNSSDMYERNRVRKIISTWSSEQVAEFMNKIKTHNKQHKKTRKLVGKQYKLWTNSSFNVHFLNKLDQDISYYLIYEFLKSHDELNNSKSKIKNIITFVLNNSGNKEFRLANIKKLVIKNQCLKIVN